VFSIHRAHSFQYRFDTINNCLHRIEKGEHKSLIELELSDYQLLLFGRLITTEEKWFDKNDYRVGIFWYWVVIN